MLTPPLRRKVLLVGWHAAQGIIRDAFLKGSAGEGGRTAAVPEGQLPAVSACSGEFAPHSGAVRVMNQVLEGLGTAQRPDKTLIGRLERGFDFLGVPFTACGELSPSAVSRARHPEKTARLDERGASPERIGRYQPHGQRALRGLRGSAPPDPAPPPAPPIPPRPPAPMSRTCAVSAAPLSSPARFAGKDY